MCGICGIIGDPDDAALERMMRAIRHRGPDDRGTYRDPRAALGHHRLSIIDVGGGHQPIPNEDGTLHLVLNGEIYNHQDLRAELIERGHRFRTNCDAEVALHLYEESGPESVRRLNGMFAFGIWDSRRERLFLARDRLGIKPLFWTRVNGKFLFASELKGVLAHPAVPRRIDRVALDLYLTLMYVPAPRTIVESVSKLPPGHWLLLDDEGETVRRYWQLPDVSAGGRAEGLGRTAEEFREVLGGSVRARLMSDVPLGGYLSGGLDSSVVCALMAREATDEVHTFCVGFDERGYDERRHARTVAEQLGTDHRELVVGGDALGGLSRILWHLDEPVADAAAIPTCRMARATKEHATVVLTGEGADELFAGYPYYRYLMWAHRLGRLAPGGAWIGRMLPVLGDRVSAMAAARSDRAGLYLAMKSVFTREERRALLEPGVGLAGDDDPARDLAAPFFGGTGGRDYLSELLRFETAFWLPDDLLTKVDRMTMAHAVEARVPYLDHEVVEYAASLPSWMKTRGLSGKGLLRRTARGLVPESTRRRRKAGFGVPVGKWARAQGENPLKNIFSEESIRRRGLFRPEVALLCRPTGSHNPYARRQFWTLAVLEMWCRNFLDRDPADPPPD